MAFGVLVVFRNGREAFVEESGRVARFRNWGRAEDVAQFWREGLVPGEAQSVSVVDLEGFEGIS